MILGAVLAGGESRRFGSDKAHALLEGQPLIAHVLTALRPSTEAVIVCGREWPDEMCVPDRPAPGLGPLGNIAAALTYAQAHGFARVLVLPCDTPRIDPAMLATLVAADAAAVLRDCPVISIWPASLAPLLDAHLAGETDRSMRGWARRTSAAWLDVPAPANVNQMADLAALT